MEYKVTVYQCRHCGKVVSSSFADKCLHGILWEEECLECELAGLREKVNWMAPVVMKSKKRIAEIEVILKGQSGSRKAI